MATKADVVRILGKLAMLWPRFELTEPTVVAYAHELADIEVDILQLAAEHWGSIGNFFPSVAELRKTAFDLMAMRRGEQTAAEAWGEIMRAMKVCGPTQPPLFQNQRLRKALRVVGGWWQVCTSDNLPADRAKFFEAYAQLEAADRMTARMLPQVRAYVGAPALPMPEAKGIGDGEA